jgi:precorrin-2/cobalt-factor-2 C20-methyltransferase
LSHTYGTFYGVGIGPGDPEQLSLKALRVIKSVGHVFVPKAETKGESFALDIVSPYVDRAKVHEMVFPMIRDPKKLEEFWKLAADEMLAFLRRGEDVAFLTIGDPLTFSTYNYVLSIVRRELPEERIMTVPGITSYNAVAARASFSLAEGKEKIAILPVPDGEIASLRGILDTFDTVVLMKVAKKLDAVLDLLEEMGLTDRAVFGSYVGTGKEFVSRDLRSLKGTGRGYMSVIIVRK